MVVFADLHLQVAFFIPLTEVAPVFAIAARFRKTDCCGQRRFRGIIRSHQQLAVGPPDLEAQPALVFMGDIAEIFDVFPLVVAGQRE